MQQPGEPSVEEILTSIKQVMARDAATLAGATRAPIVPSRDAVLDLSAEHVVDPVSLVGTGAAASTRGAFDALAGVAGAGVAPSPAEPRGDGSLEATVRELLRPALAAWLDAHLPPLVERLVAAEIARIVGQRG